VEDIHRDGYRKKKQEGDLMNLLTKSKGGYTDRRMHKQQGDLINLLTKREDIQNKEHPLNVRGHTSCSEALTGELIS
jgi:hypothetical protein